MGSEDRWAEIARNMLMFSDWFHPVINGEIYFDKPLLSYWLIVAAAKLTGTLNEFSVRLPSAFSGLLTLLFSYKIAERLFDRRMAWLSVWLMITSHGFLFWTHTASAEMSNLASITAAVAWFVYRRERHDFSSYFIFYMLCAIGSQMKGLTAIVVPVLAIAPFLVRKERWKGHVNFAHLVALLLGLGLFALPYLGAALNSMPSGVVNQSNNLSGIDLLIRENVIRFFRPFDHMDPVYSYLYEVPRIVMPWSILLIAALVYYLPRYRTLNESQQWLLGAIGLIFLFFTISGSRRWYYILPIMPFCMMLIAEYIAEVREHRWQRPALRATELLLIAATAALIAVPWVAQSYFKSAQQPSEFWVGSAVTLIGAAAIAFISQRNSSLLTALTRIDPSVSRTLNPKWLLTAALLMTVLFGFFMPGTDTYRQGKTFAISLVKQIRPGENVAFFGRSNSSLVFYMNLPQAIPVINRRSDTASMTDGLVLIVASNEKEAMLIEFPELGNAVPVLAVKQGSEKLFSDKSAFSAYRLK
jgi:4-amino-4-deoxy-L-arabinose transferase-like glycosyltransferase